MVTFVFTDIEASTRLVKHLDETKARQTFDLHNQLLREVWGNHGGVEVNTEGDSFFVAFDDTRNAIAACVEAQRQLAGQTWPDELPVRVRMGIHAGIAVPHLDNYVSLAVHQAARVEAAGHGGQILATEDVINAAPSVAAATVVPLGSYRLRDFDQPVPLFRIDPDGLAPVQTAIRATPASRHNLLAINTSFVGRDSDQAIVSGLICAGSVVSLVGPGGVGKTRLATEIGIELSSSYDDGVWMVELAEVHDDELLADALAESVGASQSGTGDRWEDVVEHLRDSGALLIFDNLEQIVDVAAHRIAELVQRCPGVAVVTTSRQPLDLRIEQVYRVQPLNLSSTNDAESPASELFVDRATAADAAFKASGADNDIIGEICNRVDGLPLAIEIAAARVRTMSLPDLLNGLTNQQSVLRSRDRSLPDRHRTLHALLTWSYELLSATERRGLRRLAVFASDFSTEAAGAVLANGEASETDLLEVLFDLVDKSLITIDLSESVTRYRMAEAVQQFALELLNDANDVAAAASTAADWYLQHVGPEQPNDRDWLTNVAIELTNLRGLVDLLTDFDQRAAQRIMCSVGRFHDQVGNYSTGVDELSRTVSELREPSAARVALLATLADLHLRRGEVDQAVTFLDQAEALQPSVGRPSWDDTAVERTRGEVALRRNDPNQAVEIATAALEIANTPIGEARIRNLQGLAQSAISDFSGAIEAFESELKRWEELGLDAKIATTHGNLAEAAWRRNDVAAAAAHQRSCLELALLQDQQVLVACSLQMAARFSEQDRAWSEALVLNEAAKRLIEETGAELYSEDERLMQSVHDQAISALGAPQVEALLRDESHQTVLDVATMAMAVFGRTTESADISG